MTKSKTTLEDLHDRGIDVDRRKISLYGEINIEKAEKFINNLEYLYGKNNEPVWVTLCSPGGDVNAGFAMYDAIRAAGNVVVVGTGEIMSMAVAILQAGKVRLATPNTRFMVHQGSTEVSGNDDEVHAGTKETRATSRIYKNILLERMLEKSPKNASKTLTRLINKTTYFDVKKALELGLIDHEGA